MPGTNRHKELKDCKRRVIIIISNVVYRNDSHDPDDSLTTATKIVSSRCSCFIQVSYADRDQLTICPFW